MENSKRPKGEVELTCFGGNKSLLKAVRRSGLLNSTIPMKKAIHGKYNPSVSLKKSSPANIFPLQMPENDKIIISIENCKQ